MLTPHIFLFFIYLFVLFILLVEYVYLKTIGGVWGGRGGHCPPRSEPIDFVRSINTKIFSHCLILFALSYFNEYVKAKLFVINVKKKNLSDEKNQKLAPICDVSGQIFRSFHTAHRKRFDCKFIRREDRGHNLNLFTAPSMFHAKSLYFLV